MDIPRHTSGTQLTPAPFEGEGNLGMVRSARTRTRTHRLAPHQAKLKLPPGRLLATNCKSTAWQRLFAPRHVVHTLPSPPMDQSISQSKQGRIGRLVQTGCQLHATYGSSQHNTTFMTGEIKETRHRGRTKSVDQRCWMRSTAGRSTENGTGRTSPTHGSTSAWDSGSPGNGSDARGRISPLSTCVSTCSMTDTAEPTDDRVT